MAGTIIHLITATTMLIPLAAAAEPCAVVTVAARPETAYTRLNAINYDGYVDFMSRVYEEQMKRASRMRKPFTGLPEDQLEVVEGVHKMRKDAAELCKSLLKQARSDLKQQQKEVNQQAAKVAGVWVFSAYRSVTHDDAAWRRAFRKHFIDTRGARAKLNGGAYGDEAVKMMVKIMRRFKAPPGFSQHTRGVAVDFMTIENNVRFTADSRQNDMWKKTWFHKWLVNNAKRFKFKPLSTEAWHWEYAK